MTTSGTIAVLSLIIGAVVGFGVHSWLPALPLWIPIGSGLIAMGAAYGKILPMAAAERTTDQK